MSAEIIDITKPLEERQFEAKEERLKEMKAAFRKSRLEARAVRKKNQPSRPGKTLTSRKKKNRYPEK